MSANEETLSSSQGKILKLLSKNHRTQTSLDPNALNQATSPEWDGVRANIINHLKRTIVQDNAEGRSGDNPEENLGKGARNLIRFKPIVMKPKRNKFRESGSRQLRIMMNKGRPKVGRDVHREESSEFSTPMGAGLDRAIRARFRGKKSFLNNPNKQSLNTSVTAVGQKGLRERSKKNFKDSKKAESRRKLDTTF